MKEGQPQACIMTKQVDGMKVGKVYSGIVSILNASGATASEAIEAILLVIGQIYCPTVTEMEAKKK